MLTARDGDRDEAAALDTGADDFLAKPFSYVVLVARLRALLRRGGHERPVVLRAGDLALDPAAHRVSRGDDEIALTPRQFSLLEFLMRRTGEVLSKSEILGHVWDFAFEGDPNIVEVYVRQLRQRIDEPFGRRSLQTYAWSGTGSIRTAADDATRNASGEPGPAKVGAGPDDADRRRGRGLGVAGSGCRAARHPRACLGTKRRRVRADPGR